MDGREVYKFLEEWQKMSARVMPVKEKHVPRTTEHTNL